MANRIPLVVDTSDSNKIKELPVGDSLDLTGSAIVNATSIQTSGTLTAHDIVVNGSQLSAVALSGNYEDLDGVPAGFSGSYADLSNKPYIPTNISELNDVQPVAPNEGDILQYNSITGRYEPKQFGYQAVLANNALADIGDVVATGVYNDKFLKFYSGAWRPANVTWAEIQSKPTALSQFLDDINAANTGDVDFDSVSIQDAGVISADQDGHLQIVSTNRLNLESSSVVNVIASDKEWQFDTDGKLNFPNGMSISDIENDFLFNASFGETDVIVLRTAGGDVVVDSNGVLSAEQGIQGDLTGDVIGSVFGDDSTPIVDAVNNTLNANSITVSSIAALTPQLGITGGALTLTGLQTFDVISEAITIGSQGTGTASITTGGELTLVGNTVTSTGNGFTFTHNGESTINYAYSLQFGSLPGTDGRMELSANGVHVDIIDSSNAKAFRMPVYSFAEHRDLAITSPEKGMIVFLNDTSADDTSPTGVKAVTVYDGSTWRRLNWT